MLAKLLIREKRQLRDFECSTLVHIICPPNDLKEYSNEEVDRMTGGYISTQAKELAIINYHVEKGFTPKFSFATTSEEGRITLIEIFMEMPRVNPEASE